MRRNTLIGSVPAIMVLSVAVIAIASIFGIGLYASRVSSLEVTLRKEVARLQKANETDLARLEKDVSFATAATPTQLKNVRSIVVDFATARTETVNGYKIRDLVRELFPEATDERGEYLVVVITVARDNRISRLDEIISLNNDHRELRTTFPSKLFVGGRSQIDLAGNHSPIEEPASFMVGKSKGVDLFPAQE